MSYITKLKLTTENLKEVEDVNVNISSKEALKNSSISDVKLAEFKYHCQKMYKATAEKLIDRSPLKLSVVCDLACMSSKNIANETASQLSMKFEGLLHTLNENKLFSSTHCDSLIKEYKSFVSFVRLEHREEFNE